MTVKSVDFKNKRENITLQEILETIISAVDSIKDTHITGALLLIHTADGDCIQIVANMGSVIQLIGCCEMGKQSLLNMIRSD